MKKNFIDHIIIGSLSSEIIHFIINTEIQDKSSGKITHKLNQKSTLLHVNQINQLPQPRFDCFKISDYKKLATKVYQIKNPPIIFGIPISFGCPFNCIFCRRPTYGKFELRKINLITRDIKTVSKKYNLGFYLLAEQVNADPEWSKNLFSELMKVKHVLQWYSYSTPLRFTGEFAEKASAAGCKLLMFGVETGSKSLLQKMNKPFDIRDANMALKNASKAGIWVHVNLILGYPEENLADIEETIHFLRNNKKWIDSIRLNYFVLHSNTNLTKKLQSSGYKIKYPTAISFKITSNSKKYSEFKIETLERIKRLCKSIEKMEFSFAGAVPQAVFSLLCVLKEKEKVHQYINMKFSHLNFAEPLDVLHWKTYHKNDYSKYISYKTWDDFYGNKSGYFPDFFKLICSD